MSSPLQNTKIALHQFMICENFSTLADDGYVAKGIRSNLYVPSFPYSFLNLFVVTCWRKDERFHKEVIEYAFEDEPVIRTPHMDIEPITNQVIFRWHTHKLPPELVIPREGTLKIRVVLDWQVLFESYLLVEKRP
jgi:hypothetical protein